MIRIFPVTKKNTLYWKLSIPQPELSKDREKIEEKSQNVPRPDSGFFHTLEELTLFFSENASLVRIMGLWCHWMSLDLLDCFMERSDNCIIPYKDSALRYEMIGRKWKLRKRIRDLVFSIHLSFGWISFRMWFSQIFMIFVFLVGRVIITC